MEFVLGFSVGEGTKEAPILAKTLPIIHTFLQCELFNARERATPTVCPHRHAAVVRHKRAEVSQHLPSWSTGKNGSAEREGAVCTGTAVHVVPEDVPIVRVIHRGTPNQCQASRIDQAEANILRGT